MPKPNMRDKQENELHTFTTLITEHPPHKTDDGLVLAVLSVLEEKCKALNVDPRICLSKGKLGAR